MDIGRKGEGKNRDNMDFVKYFIVEAYNRDINSYPSSFAGNSL